ncbi:MAG: hypothetical protein HPY59_15830 [Anaerolineae bacterium]|nr:hypothetical protein [Anaerolineae bacterium]
MNSTNKFTGLQIGIVFLTMATALIHFYLNVIMGKLDILFTLNGLGYLALLAGLYLPLPVARDHRRLVRVVMIGYTVLTIVLWVFMGKPYTMLGYITKLIELSLVILLLFKRP